MRNKRNRRRGNSIIEMTLMMPWIVFLFVGTFDWGFYAHALISTESAARVAALAAANSGGGKVSASAVCTSVLGELSIASNVSGVTSCTAAPVVAASSCTTTGGMNSVQVAVTYRTLQLIPIPGLLEGQATLYRVVQMPMQDNNTCSSVA
jgi:Flp pilus assembly protein TadG